MKSFRVIRLFPGIGLLLLLLNACSDSQPHLAPLKPGDTILAFGDSLTWGTGAAPDHAWPAEFARISKHPVINAGVPGEITAEGLQRLPALLKQHHPALVVILHGGNDLLRKYPQQDIARNLQAMIEMTRKTGAQPVLVAVPHPSLLLSDAELYRQVARSNQVPVLENRLSDLLGSSAMRSDRIHLNAAGYGKLARLLHDFIRQQGGLE
ncbi:arylesterase [Thiolapillus sp.]